MSRVLNGASGISRELRERVLKVASELGYPDRQGAGTVRKIHFVTPLATLGSSGDPFHTDIFKGAEAECLRQGVQLNLVTIEGHPNARLAQQLDPLCDDAPSAALVLAVDDPTVLRRILSSHTSVVGVNIDHPHVDMDMVLPDNWGGGYLATSHLIGLGHRRILHLTHLKRRTLQRRHEGYRAALDEAGIHYDSQLVIETPLSPEAAHDTMQHYLRAQRPDFSAMFCVNDRSAIGAVHALQEAGLRVPEHVSVIGFDDIPMAAFLSPDLSTMRVPREELGALAVRRLLERLTVPTLTPSRIELATQLIERGSVKAF